MYVCLCRGITDQDIKTAIREGAETTLDIAQQLGAGTGCGACVEYTQSLIDQEKAQDLTYAA